MGWGVGGMYTCTQVHKYTSATKPQWVANRTGWDRIDLKPSGADGQHECSGETGRGQRKCPRDPKVKPKQIRICSKQGKCVHEDGGAAVVTAVVTAVAAVTTIRYYGLHGT